MKKSFLKQSVRSLINKKAFQNKVIDFCSDNKKSLFDKFTKFI